MFSYAFCEFSRRLLLSLAIIRQKHFKCEKNESNDILSLFCWEYLLWCRLLYHHHFCLYPIYTVLKNHHLYETVRVEMYHLVLFLLLWKCQKMPVTSNLYSSNLKVRGVNVKIPMIILLKFWVLAVKIRCWSTSAVVCYFRFLHIFNIIYINIWVSEFLVFQKTSKHCLLN